MPKIKLEPGQIWGEGDNIIARLIRGILEPGEVYECGRGPDFRNNHRANRYVIYAHRDREAEHGWCTYLGACSEQHFKRWITGERSSSVKVRMREVRGDGERWVLVPWQPEESDNG